MFIGIIYLLLSLAALFFLQFDPAFCVSGTCSATADQAGYFLGRPWWIWGALFYALAGVLCLGLRKNRATGAFLAAGAVFHIGLIIYFYSTSGAICPACWKFAALGALLAAMYWLSAERKKYWGYLVSAGPARALSVIVLAMLLLNPQGQTLTGAQVASSIESEGIQVPKIEQTGSMPKAAEASDCTLLVSTPDGAQACLDMRQKPVLFFAVWCPHCPEALKEVAKLEPEKRPYLVVIYLRQGDTEKVKVKLAEARLAGEAYYLAQSPPAGVQGVPSLIFWWDGGLKHVEGVGAIAENLSISG